MTEKTRDAKTLRKIKPLPVVRLRNVVANDKPTFEWVDPASLYVEEDYQRSMGGRSRALINKIVSGFSWARFKPPVCVRLDDGKLVVMDGQHSATAAVSHGGVELIPVMIVTAKTIEDRANAFIGHNSDRLAITSLQLFHAAVAAGDVGALAAAKACEVAGVRILASVTTRYEVGDTVSVAAIQKLATTTGYEKCAAVLSVLVAAKRTPIKAGEIRAVATMLDKHQGAKIDSQVMGAVIGTKSDAEWAAMAQLGMNWGADGIAELWLRTYKKAKGLVVAPTFNASKKCLRCSKPFIAEHKHNRMCYHCKTTNSD